MACVLTASPKAPRHKQELCSDVEVSAQGRLQHYVDKTTVWTKSRQVASNRVRGVEAICFIDWTQMLLWGFSPVRSKRISRKSLEERTHNIFLTSG